MDYEVARNFLHASCLNHIHPDISSAWLPSSDPFYSVPRHLLRTVAPFYYVPTQITQTPILYTTHYLDYVCEKIELLFCG